jgi:hypothetical protein
MTLRERAVLSAGVETARMKWRRQPPRGTAMTRANSSVRVSGFVPRDATRSELGGSRGSAHPDSPSDGSNAGAEQKDVVCHDSSSHFGHCVRLRLK